MTFSIIASNPNKKELCVATSTCLVGVGHLVPMVIPNVGAIAAQAKVKPSNRLRILKLIKSGYSPHDSIKKILKDDNFKEHRQIIAMNSKGLGAVFSGNKTIDFSDYYVGENYIVAGNMLKSKNVIKSISSSFAANPSVFLPERCLISLMEGEKMGGDIRGRMSASINYSNNSKNIVQLCIDYSKDPLKNLFKALNLRFSKEFRDIFDL